MSSIEHGHVITTEAYYNGELASSKQEIEVSIFSTKDTILKDIIDSLGIISGGTSNKLQLNIQVDPQGRYRLIKKWLI
jgi:hypothetical protein